MALSDAADSGAGGLVPLGNQRRVKSFREAQCRLAVLELGYSVWGLATGVESKFFTEGKRYADRLSEHATYVCIPI